VLGEILRSCIFVCLSRFYFKREELDMYGIFVTSFYLVILSALYVYLS